MQYGTVVVQCGYGTVAVQCGCGTVRLRYGYGAMQYGTVAVQCGYGTETHTLETVAIRTVTKSIFLQYLIVLNV